ncbi:MAG: hypothetical protein ACRC6N_08110 [Plesiomonas sp.]
MKAIYCIYEEAIQDAAGLLSAGILMEYRNKLETHDVSLQLNESKGMLKG